jgi:hypothetical protein
MKVTHILCAMLACASLTFEARATSSSEEVRSSSSAAADAGDAAGRTQPSHDASTNAQHPGNRGSPQPRARTGDASKGRDTAAAASPRRGPVTPPPGAGKAGIGQAGRGNADRLGSMLNAQARGPLARQHSRPVASTRGAASSPGLHGPQGTSPAGPPTPAASNGAGPPAAMPAGQPKLVASNGAGSPAAKLAATSRGLVIGGPRIQSAGRVGGPAINRTTRGATIDGSQPHHKF